jgi:hypothetical protein
MRQSLLEQVEADTLLHVGRVFQLNQIAGMHRCIEEKTAAGTSSHGPPDPRLFLQIAFSTVAPSLAH